MKHKVIINAEGDNASGKSYLLEKIKTFLENDGFEVNNKALKSNHKIIVLNEY